MKYCTTRRGREGLKGDKWKTLLQTFFQQEKAAWAPISTECKSGASGGLVGGQFGYRRQKWELQDRAKKTKAEARSQLQKALAANPDLRLKFISQGTQSKSNEED